jgi:hypothetical protein
LRSGDVVGRIRDEASKNVATLEKHTSKRFALIITFCGRCVADAGEDIPSIYALQILGGWRLFHKRFFSETV